MLVVDTACGLSDEEVAAHQELISNVVQLTKKRSVADANELVYT